MADVIDWSTMLSRTTSSESMPRSLNAAATILHANRSPVPMIESCDRGEISSMIWG
jgi:hypothetical protein